MAGVTFGDELVRDYLVYRGFLSALKSFDAEVKTDRDRGFRPDRIVEHLSMCINNLDLNALREAWSHLDQRVFSRLEHSFLGTARKLENALHRMYVVTCIVTNRHDKLLEFFEKMTSELQGQSEWKEWFALPFLKNPEENPTFSVFFTRQWQDTMLVSLHNFISVVFQSVATPMLLNYEEELFRHNALQEENEILKGKLSAIQLGESEPHKNGSENDCQEIGAPAELMDDFYVIAQEVPVENQSRSIKTLIRNISSGLPTSPILGRRHQSQDGSRRQDDFSSVGGSKSSKLKPRSPSVPPQPSSALISECTKLKQEFECLNRSSSSKDESASPDMGTKFSCGKVQPLLQLPCSSITSVSDPKGGFLLLSQEEFTEHNSFITHCKFNSSGSVVASADMDGVIKIWTTSPSPHTLSTIMSKSSVLALEWGSKRERLLLHGGVAGHVRLYDTKERKIIGDVSVDSSSSLNNLRITCLACSPTESCFVASTSIQGSNSIQGQLYIWDMRTLQMEHCLPISMSNSCAYCCSFNHNGQLLLAGTSDGRVYIFDMRTSEVIAKWTAHANQVFTTEFSIDETTCYTMGGDGKFIQWSVNKTGQRIGELDIHSGATGPFTSNNDSFVQQYNPVGKLFAFNNSGSHILTCGLTGGIIYKVSGNSLTDEVNIGGHSQPVNTVDWATAMECSTCLTGSIDGRISVSTLLAH